MEWKPCSPDEMSTFVREHLLPRLDRLESELYTLRQVTWPVCQSMLDSVDNMSIYEKWEFLNILHSDDQKHLLECKNRIKKKLCHSVNGLSHTINEEWRLISELDKSRGNHIAHKVVE